MTLKNILVHVNSEARTAARLDVAKSLARRSGACLVGVFGQLAEAEQVGIVFNWPSQEYAEAVETARAMFEQATADLPHTGWHDINRGSESEVVKHITSYARYGDLMVLGQPDIYAEDDDVPQLPEEVATASGRPVLVIPRSGEFPVVGRRPLIVWNDSREAARALKDSLALMEEGTEAVLLSLANKEDQARQSCLEVERYLACHGISVQTEVHTACREGAWKLVLDRLADTGADLLVVGAHWQLGFPFIKCEVVLQEVTVPLLTAG